MADAAARMSPSSTPWILGLSESHNGAACLLRGGELVVAVQEERLTRTKRQRVRADREALCIRYCLDHAGIQVADLAAVAVAPLGGLDNAIHRLRRNPMLAAIAGSTPFFAYSHHLAHAAYAAAMAGEERVAILVADGIGSAYDMLPRAERRVMANAVAAICGGSVELWESVSIYTLADGVLAPRFKQLTTRACGEPPVASGKAAMSTRLAHGLGAMYERASQVIFGSSQQSGKVMGLAPFGKALLPIDAFHAPRPDQALEYSNPPELSLERMQAAIAQRGTLEPMHPASTGLAAAVQGALEDGMLHFARLARSLTDMSTLILSGGVALNGVANERIIRETGFTKVHLPPAVEDCGNAVGVAYLALWEQHGWRKTTPVRVDAIGRHYSGADIDAAIAANPLIRAEVLGDRMIETAVTRLLDGQILGWLQGRSEFGPRALGQRSILCDPRPADAKDRLNARVKRREAFRPFAPLVLAEHATAWFELTRTDGTPIDPEGPFMTRVVPIRPEKRGLIPAVTHVDGTGRFQTVSPANGAIHDLLTAFHERTGVPVLLNTSFNIAQEPIVETPADALFDLLLTDIDAVILGDRLATRRDGRAPGILDLVPKVIAQRISSAQAEAEELEEHCVRRLDMETFVRVYVRAAHPLGGMPVQISKDQATILVLADGRRSGRAILELARKAVRNKVIDERWLESVIAELVRLRVVELSAPGAAPVRLI